MLGVAGIPALFFSPLLFLIPESLDSYQNWTNSKSKSDIEKD